MPGVLVKEGVYSLNNSRFLEGMEERQNLNDETRQKSAAKKLAEVTKYRAGVLAIRANFGADVSHGFEHCTLDKCCDYLQYKKMPKDKAMPKDSPGRQARCV